jgi:dihydroxyacetone synthase
MVATREVNGIVSEKLWEACPAICGGGADLVNSNKLKYSDSDIFPPDSACGFKGRYIRYGIREYAVAAISNGLTAFSQGSCLPITATFFMFYLYVRCPLINFV